VRLDVGDVRRSARKGVLRIYGKGGKVREVPIHAKLRPGLERWLTERTAWPGAGASPALFLNTKGGRLPTRAADGIIAAIAEQAALDDDPTAHRLEAHVRDQSWCATSRTWSWSPSSWGTPAWTPRQYSGSGPF
jgi:site-specific recombinase XerD